MRGRIVNDGIRLRAGGHPRDYRERLEIKNRDRVGTAITYEPAPLGRVSRRELDELSSPAVVDQISDLGFLAGLRRRFTIRDSRSRLPLQLNNLLDTESLLRRKSFISSLGFVGN